MNQLLTSSLIYGLGQALNRFLAFFLLPLFTRYLTPEDYGVTAILAVLSLINQNLFSWGLGTSISLCYFNEDSKRKKILGNAVLVLLFSSIIILLIGFFWADTINSLLFKHENYHYLIFLTLLSNSITLIGIRLSLYFQLENKAKIYILLTQLNTIITTGLCVWMVVVRHGGVKGYVEAYLLAQLIAFIIQVAIIFKLKGLVLNFNFPIIKELLTLGAPQIFAYWGMFILQHSHKLIIQQTAGLAKVGLYSIAFNFSSVMSMFVNSFCIAWTPYIFNVSKEHKNAEVIFGKIATYYFLIFGFIATIICINSRSLVIIMTDSKYHSVYPLIGICSFAQICYGIYSIQATEAFLAKDSFSSAFVQFFSSIISFPLSYLLIFWIGDLGASFSFLFGFIILIGFQHYLNKKKTNYIQIQYEWKKISYLLGLFLFICLPFSQLRSWSLIIELSVSILTSALVSLLFYTKLSAEEKLWIKNYITKKKSNI